MRVLGISGSLRRDSYNSGLLRAAADLLPSGAELEVFDGLKAIPPYDADDDVDPAPEAVAALRDAIADADAVLVATPEYNASIPGVLKNALDWASRPHATNPLRGKPAAVVGASTGMFGAVWAQADTRKVLSTIGARVLDVELPVPEGDERFDAAGTLQRRRGRGAARRDPDRAGRRRGDPRRRLRRPGCLTLQLANRASAIRRCPRPAARCPNLERRAPAPPPRASARASARCPATARS